MPLSFSGNKLNTISQLVSESKRVMLKYTVLKNSDIFRLTNPCHSFKTFNYSNTWR
jgi:hypothetical protein